MYKNKKEIFEYGNISINYRITSQSEMSFSPFFEFQFDFLKEDEPVVYIEWIENSSNQRGEGAGTKALSAFIKEIENNPKADHIVLQSNFNEDNYNETYGMELSIKERIEAIGRLVRFYERVGFRCEEGVSYSGEDPLACPNMYYNVESNTVNYPAINDEASKV